MFMVEFFFIKMVGLYNILISHIVKFRYERCNDNYLL